MRRLNRELLGKLTQLPTGECPELLRAQASLVHAQVLVWTRARGPDWRVKKFAELGPMKVQEPS